MRPSATPTLTQKWLIQNIRFYPNSDRLYPDVDAALARYPALRPKTDIYTYDDGRTQLMLCLHGLLPIAFRGASYNIPVALWFPLAYPREPPIVYVVPTSDMLVKATKHVEVSGRCDLDYMHDWLRKPEACSLPVLLEYMQDYFSQQPPVYSKPRTASPARQSTPESIDRPRLPPKPPSVASPSSPSSAPHRPIIASPPPVPPHPRPPPSIGPGPPPYPSPHHQPSASPTIPTARWSTPQHPVPPPQPPQHPRSPVHQSPQYTPAPPPPNLLDDDDSRLLSNFQSTPQPAATGPAPPRPPNPELLRLHTLVHQKLTASFTSLHQTLTADSERQQLTQRDLLAGEPALRDEMGRLEAVRAVCRTVSQRLRGAVEDAERNVAELRRKGDPEVDELVCSTSIVHNQLINLVAEDNAIEDTIYHLHRALNAGRIDLERFLRTTRVLAEEQYMKRALVEKIHNGLPMGSRAIGQGGAYASAAGGGGWV